MKYCPLFVILVKQYFGFNLSFSQTFRSHWAHKKGIWGFWPPSSQHFVTRKKTTQKNTHTYNKTTRRDERFESRIHEHWHGRQSDGDSRSAVDLRTLHQSFLSANPPAYQYKHNPAPGHSSVLLYSAAVHATRKSSGRCIQNNRARPNTLQTSRIS